MSLRPQRFIQGLSIAAFTGAMLLAGPVGCSSPPKAVDIPASANVNDEAARLEDDIQNGFKNHYDVLAQGDFDNAQAKLRKARKEISDGAKTETVLTSLGMARAYMDRAREKSERLTGSARGILDARTAALDAGAHNYPRVQAALKQVDDDLRAEVSNLEKGRTSTSRWADLQKSYMNVELFAIQDSRLGNPKAQIYGAIQNGARKNTPNALQQAERDVRNAENVIAASRHDETAIEPAVQKAVRSSEMLVEVLAATKRPEGVINEDAARAIVLQGRKLRSLNAQLGEASQEAAAANKEAAAVTSELQSTAATVKLNQALESARKEFSSDEAEVYRQGDKLLIRLKAVNFPSGRADLPTQSLPLFSKVKSITEELNPTSVVVQGHTDSTGKKQFNKVLSQERAETVAKYLAENGVDQDKINAIGYGWDKPLADNKSKEGRAENRRVDIVITPGPTTVGSSPEK